MSGNYWVWGTKSVEADDLDYAPDQELSEKTPVISQLLG